MCKTLMFVLQHNRHSYPHQQHS